jgi:hypothetical protein
MVVEYRRNLIDCLRLRPSQEFFTYMEIDVTIAGEGLQNLGLCSALRAFEQGGIFIVTGASVFPISDEGPPHSVASYHTHGFPISAEGPPHSIASYDTHGDAEDLF